MFVPHICNQQHGDYFASQETLRSRGLRDTCMSVSAVCFLTCFSLLTEKQKKKLYQNQYCSRLLVDAAACDAQRYNIKFVLPPLLDAEPLEHPRGKTNVVGCGSPNA